MCRRIFFYFFQNYSLQIEQSKAPYVVDGVVKPQHFEQAPIAWGMSQTRKQNNKKGGAMAQTEMFLEDEIHPIDIVEHLAEHHEWEFDRIEENQIAMAVQGQWRTYSITLAWSVLMKLYVLFVHLKWNRLLRN